MFLSNLIVSNIFGGIWVGIGTIQGYSLIKLCLLWCVVSLLHLFVFNYKSFSRFTRLVQVQEIVLNTKVSANPNIIWLVLNLFSAFTITFITGFLISRIFK